MIKMIRLKGNGCSFKLSLVLLLMAALLILAIPAISGAEEAVTPSAAEEKQPAASELPSIPCKGLKPFNNLEELLYQFYINLESNCLFEMPITELEKMWGIKILTEEKFNPENYYPLAETDFYFKPYKSEKDAFYVEYNECKKGNFDCRKHNATRFKVKITKEYHKTYGTLFPDKKKPAFLPSPDVAEDAHRPLPCVFPQLARSVGLNERCAFPRWKSSDYRREINLYDSNEVRFEVYSLMANKSPEKAHDNLSAGALPKASAKAKNAPCRGLKAVNNVDDLIYQFYINLNSDCLFNMSLAELEKIWGIKLYSSNTCNSKRTSAVSAEDLNAGFEAMNSVYGGNPKDVKNSKLTSYMPGDGDFGVRVDSTGAENRINSFSITMTKAHKNKQDTFFPNNRVYPAFLPIPEMRMNPYRGDSRNAYKEMKEMQQQSNVINKEKEKEKEGDPFAQFNFLTEDFFNKHKEEGGYYNKIKPILDNYSFVLFNSDKTRKILYKDSVITIDAHVNF